MLITFIANILALKIVFGYSYLFKNFINTKNDVKVYNIDFVYGIFFLSFILIFFNFFIAIFKIKIIILIVGFILFIIGIKKKNIKISYFKIVSFILIFSIFTYWNYNNVDSPVYHIQTIKWIHDYKITFGLAVLDWHYALNSIWHILLSLFNFQYKGFNLFYVFTLVPISIFLAETLNNEKYSISNLCIYYCSLFLILFSLIHPYKNGIIFNHLGNPEVDIIGMVFFILTGYIFLKNYEDDEKYDFNLLLICSIICPFIKLTYIGSLFFPLIIFYKKKYNLNIFFSKLGIFLSSIILLQMIRSYILNSCLLFPIKFTCIPSKWSLSNDQVQFYLNQTQSFARDTRLREKYTNFDYTIHSNDWIIPWVKDYFINDAFLNISFFIFFSSLIFFILNKFKGNKKININVDKLYPSMLLLFLINFFIWFKAPEIRFGWGILIFFPSLLFTISIINLNYFSKIYKRYSSKFLFLICVLLVLKNINNFRFENIILPFEKSFDYSQINIIYKSNDIDVYKSNDWKCADFKKICINKPKKNYSLKYINNYLFISTNDFTTF